MAGTEGFEPPNAGTKNRCLTTWRRPNIFLQERHILYNKSVAFSTDRKSLGDISLRGLRVTQTRLAPQAPTSC